MSNKHGRSSSLNIMEASTGYGSEFEYDSERERKRLKRKDLTSKEPIQVENTSSSKKHYEKELKRYQGEPYKFGNSGLDAFTRHKLLVNNYLLYYPGAKEELFRRDSSKDKKDVDVIREHHQFLWHEDDAVDSLWEKRIAKKYYDKLFKEYCICDLSRYKENKVAMRWRIEAEVISGKGQFQCGNKKCGNTESLRSWEVNFGYVEHGEKKNALVKLRLCLDCSYKLNYHHKRKDVTKKQTKKTLTHYGGHELTPTSATTSKDIPSSSSKGTNLSNLPEDETEQVAESAEHIWKAPVKLAEDKTRDEEFEEYFEDLFL